MRTSMPATPIAARTSVQRRSSSERETFVGTVGIVMVFPSGFLVGPPAVGEPMEQPGSSTRQPRDNRSKAFDAVLADNDIRHVPSAAMFDQPLTDLVDASDEAEGRGGRFGGIQSEARRGVGKVALGVVGDFGEVVAHLELHVIEPRPSALLDPPELFVDLFGTCVVRQLPTNSS